MTETPPTNELDIGQLPKENWPKRELGLGPGGRSSRFQTAYKQSVLDQIHLHGQGAKDTEICGVLVGTVYQDVLGPYLLVEHCIPGNNAASKATAVTFTADTWQHIQQTMDKDYPKKKIVGWYHTHPGFGIFLSDMDVFICDHFFNLPWQVAFVYDPKSGEEGNFIWRRGRPQRDPILVESDVTKKSAKIPLISKRSAMAGSAGSVGELETHHDEKTIELLGRVRQLERRQRLVFWLFTFLAAFVVVWAYQTTGPNIDPTKLNHNTATQVAPSTQTDVDFAPLKSQPSVQQKDSINHAR